jgi:hypothetical protein
MIDAVDIFALVVIAVLLAAVVVVVVGLGSLPGAIARKRGHPQAAAVNAASWLGVATLGLLWPLAFIWAFYQPSAAAPASAGNPGPRQAPVPDSTEQLVHLQAPGVSSRWAGPCRGTGGLPAVRKVRLGVKWPPGKSIRTELRGGPP